MALVLGRLWYTGGVPDGECSMQTFTLSAVLNLLVRTGEIRIEVLLSRDWYWPSNKTSSGKTQKYGRRWVADLWVGFL